MTAGVHRVRYYNTFTEARGVVNRAQFGTITLSGAKKKQPTTHMYCPMTAGLHMYEPCCES